MQAELKEIAVDRLKPSPTNPRKSLGDLAELVESVRSKGIIEPIIARAIAESVNWEIVCGHRRHAAATAAELATVPVLVREISDDDVLDIQLAENLERNDLTPLEEAEAYEYRVKRGQTIAHIAERIGRTPAYVAQRMKLTELSQACREALAKDEITLGVALVLARVPQHKLQDEALRGVSGDEYRGPLPAARAAEHIRERFMLKLAAAPFDRADAELVDGAPACTVCPKRTGNQVELFSDVKSPDLCTDPACYRSKVDAQWKRIAAAAKKGGAKVLPDKEARATFHQHGLRYSAKWSDVDSETWNGTRHVKVKSLVGKDVEVTLARNPHTGTIHKLVPASAVKKATAKAKKSTGASSPKKTPAQKAAAERDKAKAEAKDAIAKATVAAIVETVETLASNADEALFRLLLPRFVDAFYDGVEFVEQRRGLTREEKAKLGARSPDPITVAAKTLDVNELRALVLEIVLGDSVFYSLAAGGDLVSDACKAFHIDAKLIEKQVLEELKAKAAEEKSAAGKNGKKSPAKKPAKPRASAKPRATTGAVGIKSKRTRTARAAGSGSGAKPKQRRSTAAASVEAPPVAPYDDAYAGPRSDLCRGCGCSELDPCPAGCAWAEPGLCTNCVGEKPKGRKKASAGERAQWTKRNPSKPGRKSRTSARA